MPGATHHSAARARALAAAPVLLRLAHQITGDPDAAVVAVVNALSRRPTAHAHADEAAVEETFVNRNPSSTLRLGVARGVVLLAPAEYGLPVAEYSANFIKKAVVGAGHAEKSQVQLMVRRLLPGCDGGEPDAADALAVAICHAHHATARRLLDAPA